MRFITKISSSAGLALALVAAGACNRGPDPAEQVSQALKDAKLDEVKVDWDKDARIAHLKGSVDQSTDRQRAEDVATAAVGTSGRVLNELTVKNVDDTVAGDLDSGIHSYLKDTIAKDPDLRDRDIDFDVNNGVVTVKGDVRTSAEKARVTDIVRAAPGVKDLANALEIKPAK
jgi:hyperosmotically inducible protein